MNLPKDLITIDEFLEEVWEVEHLRVHVNVPKNEIIMVPHYPYTEPASNDLTADEFLEQRINPIIQNESYKWTGTATILED